MMTKLAASGVILLFAASVQAVDITACYQTVHQHEVGVLQVDLVCDGSGGPAIVVQRGGRLMLNGHSVSGRFIGIATDPGGRSRIEGPGEVLGAAAAGNLGCGISTTNLAEISNVVIHDNDCGITNYYNSPLRLTDVTVMNNARDGIAPTLAGPFSGKLKGTNLIVTGNGGVGIRVLGGATLEGLVATGNTQYGLELPTTHRAKLFDSQLTGNAGGDVAAVRIPQLVRVTCDHSVNLGLGGTLGICTGD